ncbi:MAG: hypothetical protein HOP19_21740, partial [Acidobacteria bacterium]|nr:hypothetical protein [Acidobacteriota bacterium]
NAQNRIRRPREAVRKDTAVSTRAERDRQIAAQFAPQLHQGLGENPRADFITNFDFDGDWRGDNNWNNLNDRKFPLRAYVYYSVTETPTHYFVHYAFFHPRDYKGDVITSTLLDSVLRQTLPRIGKDPTGRADDVALSHENDLEGCLVVAAKNGDGKNGADLNRAQVQYVEAMAHNAYLKYYAPGVSSSVGDPIELDGSRPRLFIEPKGHGVVRYTGDAVQLNQKVKSVLVYNYTGRADEPDAQANQIGGTAGYDLVPMYDTLWQRAQKGANETFGETTDYATRAIQLMSGDSKIAPTEQAFGQIGTAFLGKMGFQNKARPPWAWYDESERDRPRGEWFFDPASVIARHFKLGTEWSTTYSYNPYFKVE